MKKKTVSIVLFLIAFISTYLIICFAIPGMRIKLEAEPIEIFFKSITHMVFFKNDDISCRCNYIWCNSLVFWKEEVSQFQLVELNSISHRRSKVDTPCSFSLGIHKK